MKKKKKTRKKNLLENKNKIQTFRVKDINPGKIYRYLDQESGKKINKK